MSEFRIQKPFRAAIEFTETYRKHERDHIALREAVCLRAVYPGILEEDVDEHCVVAGRRADELVGFRYCSIIDKCGYFCRVNVIEKELENERNPTSYSNKLADVLNFWKGRTTIDQTNAIYQSMAQARPSGANSMGLLWDAGGRTSGTTLDFDKLLTLGIPGLMQEIEFAKQAAEGTGNETQIFEAMHMCLDMLVDVCQFYAGVCSRKADALVDKSVSQKYVDMKDTLQKITHSRPETFVEALQLFWLYALLSGVENFGRMDMYFGDFLAADITNGRLTTEQAVELLTTFWKQIEQNFETYTGVITLGGCARRNEISADRFALVAMEATLRHKGLLPQLALRLYDGQNPELLNKALDLIGAGCVYPMLYNDSKLISTISMGYHAELRDAEQYVPCDCGEYCLEHRTVSFPDSNIYMANALEVTLYNGIEPLTGKEAGIKTGDFTTMKSFEDLFDAYKKQVETAVEAALEKEHAFYEEAEQNLVFLFVSMLQDDCIKNGKGLMCGSRYKGMLMECYGNITTSDSLSAIKKLVYDDKTISPVQLLKMLDSNFIGYEKEHKRLIDAPKYGNDESQADDMAQSVHKHLCETLPKFAKQYQLDYCLPDLVNASGHVSLGKNTGSTPDGRPAGKPLTNSNNPSVGSDTHGLTALLNSLVKLDSDHISAQVQYIKLSRDWFRGKKGLLKGLLDAFFQNGGRQLMITVVNRDELENAMREPEKHKNLIVRVGGFCARFVELEKDIQMEILSRTTH